MTFPIGGPTPYKPNPINFEGIRTYKLTPGLEGRKAVVEGTLVAIVTNSDTGNIEGIKVQLADASLVTLTVPPGLDTSGLELHQAIVAKYVEATLILVKYQV